MCGENARISQRRSKSRKGSDPRGRRIRSASMFNASCTYRPEFHSGPTATSFHARLGYGMNPCSAVPAYLPIPPFDEVLIYIFRRYRNMALTYNDVVSSLFGEKAFSSREFARRTGNTRAAKVLSELKHRGLVERVARGTYRCLSPGNRPDLRGSEWTRVRNVVLAGPEPKAWAGETAVEHWTGGRYRLAPSLYSRIYSLAIPPGSEASWKAYLSNHGVSTTSRKRVGARVELIPRRNLKPELVHGEPVISRHEVEALIKGHPTLYGDAKELMLD
jgi:putative AbiEi antitoxin of type IV toxin-antitoxin system